MSYAFHFIFYWALHMPVSGPLSCIPSPLLSNFISTSFDTSHSLEQHGIGLLQDGGKFTFCLVNSLPSFQISLGVAGSGKCIQFIFLQKKGIFTRQNGK